MISTVQFTKLQQPSFVDYQWTDKTKIEFSMKIATWLLVSSSVIWLCLDISWCAYVWLILHFIFGLHIYATDHFLSD